MAFSDSSPGAESQCYMLCSSTFSKNESTTMMLCRSPNSLFQVMLSRLRCKCPENFALEPPPLPVIGIGNTPT